MKTKFLTKYTLYGQKSLEELNQTIRTFYSREDFTRKVDEYEQANGTGRATLERNLKDIFSARNFDFDEFLKLDAANRKNFLEKIPDRKKIIVEFLQKIYNDFYLEFPTGQQFMERVINRYAYDSDKKFFKDGDSLRLKILKIFCSTDENFALIENYITDKLNSAEKKSYEAFTSEQKKSFVLERLDEEIFSLLFDLNDWLKWLDDRLKRNAVEKFLLTEKISFNLADETRHQLEKFDENSAKILPELEKIFCEYLSNFYETVDGQKGDCREEIYSSEKAELLINNNCVLNVLGILGQSFFTVKEFVEFFIEVISDNDFELSENVHRDIRKNFRLQLVATNLTPTKDLFDIIASSEARLNSNDDRRQIFERAEQEIFDAKIISQADFESIKTEKLLELHKDEVRRELQKSDLIGRSYGLDLKTWRDFFLEQLDTNKPSTPFLLPKSMHKELVAYLKQFARPGNKDLPTYGHALQKAWKLKVGSIPQKKILKTADDLANLKMETERSTKTAIFQLALLLNLSDDPIGTFEKILDDIYTDNFLSSSGEFVFNANVLSEGINWKNYAEIIYLYYMKHQEMTPAERLNCAEKMISECSTAQNIPNIAPTNLTQHYYDNFFAICHLEPEDFKQRLLTEYRIESENPIMVEAQMNSARNTFNELIDKIKKKTYPPKDKRKNKNDFDIEYIKSVERNWDCGVDIVSFVKEQSDNADELSKILADGESTEIFKRRKKTLNINRTEEDTRYSDEDLMALANILKDAEFIKIFKRMEKTLNIYTRGLINKIEKDTRYLYSRTDLMAIFYLYFVRFELPDFISSGEIVEWETLFDDQFIVDLNEYLDKCRYKIFSVKSVYDNFLLFSMFVHVLNESEF